MHWRFHVKPGAMRPGSRGRPRTVRGGWPRRVDHPIRSVSAQVAGYPQPHEWGFSTTPSMATVTPMRRRLVALTATALTLAGCSGGGDAPTTSAASSPSESMTYFPSTSAAPTSSAAGHASGTSTAAPSPVSATADGLPVPVMPAAAKANTPDGAAAFARYYIDLVNYGLQKPDPAPLRAASTPTCKTCASFAERATSYVRDQVRADRAPLTIRSADASSTSPEGNPTAIVVTHQENVTLIARDGRRSKPSRTDDLSLQVELRHIGQGWLVVEIRTVA